MYWAHVAVHAPPSLTTALEQAQSRAGMDWPEIPNTSKQSFFERCQSLPPKFFEAVYRDYRERLLEISKPIYHKHIGDLLDRFTNILAIDGSRLDAIAHRLKILWGERAQVLPGCVTAAYDLVRGIPRIFRYDPDAASAEIHRAVGLLDEVPVGTLLLGDRLYANAAFFHEITQRGLYGLFRRNRTLGLRKIRRLHRERVAGGVLEDWLVEAGSGSTAPVQTLRWICFRMNGISHELLTNVLDPQKLPADIAWILYPCRWNIERMFYDLKEVLNLHRFYSANPNAVAMQVYASVMVYTAFRVAQGLSASQAGVEPEEISTAKLFPKLASLSEFWAGVQTGTRIVRRLNPEYRLKMPNWRRYSFATIPLSSVLVEHRNGRRRKRRYCLSRRRWKSFAHVSGGPTLIRELT
jgi:hypothetical protein